MPSTPRSAVRTIATSRISAKPSCAMRCLRRPRSKPPSSKPGVSSMNAKTPNTSRTRTRRSTSAPRSARSSKRSASPAAAAEAPARADLATMPAMKVSVIILAAGQGKRMKSDLPKVLQPLAGRPLLRHVIDVAQSLEPASVHVVYGHGGELVRETLQDETVKWVLQAEQLGTGHAVLQAAPDISDDHLALVMYGDVPLIRRTTLEELVKLAGANALGLLTMVVEDPTGYGRIVRSARGQVQKILECNTGVLVAPVKRLKRWLGRLKNDNAQREYLLTDIIAMAVEDKVKVNPLVAPSASEVLGVNDKTQLAEVEALRRAQVNRELMLAGVTLADPTRVDVRGTLTHASDVFIDVNVVFEGRVSLG